MTGPGSLQDVGDRIEELLDQLGGLPDRRARQWAEELVRLVLDLYGAGLERIVELGCADDAAGGDALLERLVADELVSSLLARPRPPSAEPAGAGRARPRRDPGPRWATATCAFSSSTRSGPWSRVRLLSPDSTVPAAMESRVRKLLEQAAPEILEVEVDRPAHVSLEAALRTSTAGSDGNGNGSGEATPVQLRRKVEAGT